MAISRSELTELLDQMDWYRRCLEDVQDGRVVRGLGEARAGYDRAHDKLRSKSLLCVEVPMPNTSDCANEDSILLLAHDRGRGWRFSVEAAEMLRDDLTRAIKKVT